MHEPPSFPAQPKRDFRTPRRSVGERLRGWVKPLAVIAIASAMPAFTASGSFSVFESEPEPQPLELMPFEVPGENFPGSAFYYLEQSPQLVEFAGYVEPVEVIGAPAMVEAASGELTELVAPRLRVSGTDRDHMRAQQCLTQAIYYEAASESESGQRAVAQVVLNRVAHPAYPRSVCGVVYQGSERTTGCQFTFTCDGSLARRPSQSGWNRASRIAREAIGGVVYARVGTATHYHTLAVNPYWASSLESVGIIGAHIFYRWPGSAGRPDAFTAGYGGSEPAPGRARATSPQAPDPVAPPDMASYAPPVPQPDSADAPPSGPEADANADTTPRSGDIRPEYANSGRWIERP